MSVKNWEHFFKPEVRSSGRSLFSQRKVLIRQPSDTEIAAFIRTTSPFKVSLKTKSIDSNTIYADCNCPVGKKDLFCKHIWAVLLATEEKNPDFFEDKIEISKMESTLKSTTFKEKPSTQTRIYEENQTALKQKQAAYKEQQKEKQSAYRKEQYQKQKSLKNRLKKNLPLHDELLFPKNVEQALLFFSQNGFDLREILNKEVVNATKKKLARVFHPDLGGSHDEILELNKQSEILINYLTK